MSFMNERFYKTTRKDHVCMYCNREIKAGEPRYAVVGIYGGEFQNYSLCPWCSQYMAEIENDGSGSFEFETGGLCERVHDAATDVCPVCECDDVEVKIDTMTGMALFACCNDDCRHEWEEKLTDLLGLKDIEAGVA